MIRCSNESSSSSMTSTITPRTCPQHHRKVISDTILTLRAAAALRDEINQLASANSSGRSSCTESQRLRDVIGDYGMTLFSPLVDDELVLSSPQLLISEDGYCGGEDSSFIHNGCGYDGCQITSVSEESPRDVASQQLYNRSSTFPTTHEKKCSSKQKNHTSVGLFCSYHTFHTEDDMNSNDANNSDFIFDHEVFPFQIEEPEDVSEWIDAPRILDDEAFQQIVDEAIPRSLRMYKWKRIFCIAKDGDLFFSMLEKCAPFKHTLLVLKTTDGNILGGFASEHWKVQDGFDKQSYFGTGTCFLFSDYAENSNPDKELSFYKWSGVNDYCQICDPETGKIAMGGGKGEFGLIIEENFLRGSTGHCSTFNNPPLIPGIDGSFEILDFEIYGLLPLLPTVSRVSEDRYSQRSLLRCQFS